MCHHIRSSALPVAARSLCLPPHLTSLLRSSHPSAPPPSLSRSSPMHLAVRRLPALRRVRTAVVPAPVRSFAAAAAARPLTPAERIHKDMQYCIQQVKQHDNDQYLCSLLLPTSARAGVHIVRAFNLELSHVESRHSIPTVGGGGLHQLQQDVFGAQAKAEQAALLAGPTLRGEHIPTEAEENQLRVGLMKLQWWRDGLETALEDVRKLQLHPTPMPSPAAATEEEVANAAHAQPVLNMLAIACKQYRLTNRWISRMIEARERSLTEGQPADINALLAHAESTSSAMLYLTLECMGIRNMHADHAASHIGKALGILLTIRSLPYNASKQQIYIPKTIINSEQVDIASVLSGHNSQALSNCVFELASIAKSHVEHARQLAPQVPKEARAALVPAVLCDRFLTRLEQHNFDVFAPELGLLPTAPAGAADPQREASTAGVTLSGSQQGFNPMRLRLQLLKHQFKGTY